jgi:group II intron reverse transcriptase/maturase
MVTDKPYNISKQTVFEAYKRVKANKGSAGIDGQSIEGFEQNLKDNLYKLWNRMSSGSYFPPPVKLVEIPKKSGGKRGLGIPTVSDRIAQMAVAIYLEPKLEPIFHDDSYGYRRNKSAIDAIGKARKMCWRYDYVIEFDIKGLFDNIDHELLMKAVRKHVSEHWIVLYIERWLKTPFVNSQGDRIERTAGTPQGGVVSPILANLFLHYAFDRWISTTSPQTPFERYADDAIIHCRSEAEAVRTLEALDKRLKECKLALHPDKTKIVYCNKTNTTSNYPIQEFDFLGYSFKRIFNKDRLGRLNFNFLCKVSDKSAKSFREKIKAMELQRRVDITLSKVAELINPTVRGWLNYFMQYHPSGVYFNMRSLNLRLVRWAMRKYKRFRRHKMRAIEWLRSVAQRDPNLFVHWSLGMLP